MKIILSPMRRDDTLSIVKMGDSLAINGETFDFGPLPDGASLPADAIGCKWIVGHVERISGVLNVTLILPHGPEASEAARFPKPIIDPEDGVVELPK